MLESKENLHGFNDTSKRVVLLREKNKKLLEALQRKERMEYDENI